MAKELGLGVTPWSAAQERPAEWQVHAQNRQVGAGVAGAFMGHMLNEQTFALVDELEKIAKAHDTTVARVALAWLVAQPGVTSTILGARTLAQLEDNVKALAVTLTADDLALLDQKTKPILGFPANMAPMFPAIHNGGTTVNGVYAAPSPFILQPGEKPY